MLDKIETYIYDFSCSHYKFLRVADLKYNLSKQQFAAYKLCANVDLTDIIILEWRDCDNGGDDDLDISI